MKHMKQWNSITTPRLPDTASLSPCVRMFVEQLYHEATQLEPADLTVAAALPLGVLHKQAMTPGALNSNL